MVLDSFIIATIKSALALFVIIDPFLAAAVFISITKGMSKKEKAREAFLAAFVALGLLLIFLFSGLLVLNLLGISFGSFIVAGGIILFILGVQTLLGIEFSKKEHKSKIVAIIIGTPLLSGPGAMTTVIILSQQYGYWPPVIASILVLLVTGVILYFADAISKFFGDRLIEVLSRVLGLVLAAMAIEFIKNGIMEMIKGFK